MKPTRKRNRPKPYDEMSTTGAMTRSSDVERSYRPIARPKDLRDPRLEGLEERSLRSQERESRDYEDFGGAKKFKDGGMVRGCGNSQMSGKGFRGDF